MKKIAVFLLASILALAFFTACSPEPESITTNTEEISSKQDTTSVLPSEEEKMSIAENLAERYIQGDRTDIKDITFTRKIKSGSFPNTEFRFRGYYVIAGFYYDLTCTFTIEVAVDLYGNPKITSYEVSNPKR